MFVAEYFEFNEDGKFVMSSDNKDYLLYDIYEFGGFIISRDGELIETLGVHPSHIDTYFCLSSIKERRVIIKQDLRNFCVNGWFYTCGDCSDYEDMINLCECENLSDLRLYRIAKDIYEHSDKSRLFTSIDESEHVYEMMKLIKENCVTYIYE